MKLAGTRFDTVQYTKQDVLHFRDGLIGFEASKNFLLLCAKDNTPFRWLQSIDEPALAFLVVDPAAYVPDYAPEVSDQTAKELALSDGAAHLVLVTASIPPGQPEEMTINLLAPIVVNASLRVGMQVVLEDAAYTIKYRVFEKADQADRNVAA
jgi:flagellar assembly factor FliW